ncbi:uncharacterized protein LOC116803527 [Drosophila sechellia]|uniref:uncharacterized protein LOC116803527 n=1 Tax=Drosophila sechellia TaxID=7238 RepID=UPI0013DDA5A7|nr:uncharacterized protein LOC116803527 [Drosophila sechellia]
MRLANKDLCQHFKNAGLDLAKLTHRRKIEIISVYFTWISLMMNTWELSTYCLDEITSTLQTIQFWMAHCYNMVIPNQK